MAAAIQPLPRAMRQQLRVFSALLLFANLALPFGQIAYAEAIGESYAKFFWGEWNAITWFSSFQMLLIALVAYANYRTASVLDDVGIGDASRRRWIWLLFALGFVFLSIDERFEFHEYVRDQILRPRDLFNVPGLRASDVSPYVYLVVGLVLGWFLLAELRLRPLALALFAAGVVVAGASVLVDTLDKDITRTWHFRTFWTSAFEEVGEIWAQMLFGFSFLVLLDARLRRLVQAGTGDGDG